MIGLLIAFEYKHLVTIYLIIRIDIDTKMSPTHDKNSMKETLVEKKES